MQPTQPNHFNTMTTYNSNKSKSSVRFELQLDSSVDNPDPERDFERNIFHGFELISSF